MIFINLSVVNFQSISDSGSIGLGPITVVVGRNNTGKSALLRAVYMIQDGSPHRLTDIRLGESAANVTLGFTELPPNVITREDDGEIYPVEAKYYDKGGQLNLAYNRNNELSLWITSDNKGSTDILRWPSREPRNLIFPSLARRHQQYYQQQPTVESASTVYPQDSNLVARVAALATAQIPAAINFRNLCREVLGFTVDVLLGQQQNQNQQLGVQVDRYNSVPLESMGAGVSGVLGLLVSLCDAKGKFFLIEEPENDLHPQALKALLDAIVAASEDNQFLITTHSSVVLTKLGAVPETIVLRTSSDSLRLPTSTYSTVSTTEERLEALRWLGYDLADFYLYAGWIIFEESSAERLIREWLIPWFAPSLSKLHTVGARGASRVTALAQSLGEMLVFAHLEPAYKHRAWVLVDGDEVGKEVVGNLRRMFPGWPAENFSHFAEENFESYYPARFGDQVALIKTINDKTAKRAKKGSLLYDVLEWIQQNPDTARQEFEVSAADVISHLTRIAEQVDNG
jgi:predicted ATPase